MSSLRPRHLVHRGVVATAGFWMTGPQVESRVLEAWVPGARVYRLGAGLLLLLPAASEVACDAAPGVPLVPGGGALLGLPLDSGELQALAPPAGSVVLARGGGVVVEEPAESARLDPAVWLDVREFQAVEARPLGARPAGAVLAVTPPSVDLRSALGGGRLQKPPEMDSVLAALLRGKPPAGEKPSWWQAAFGSWLAALARPAAAPGAGQPGAALPGAAGSPGFSFAQRLQDWAARRIARTQLASVVGTRQAQYMRQMMEMFQRGEMGDALRHAIPLSSKADEEPGLLSLSLPSPRSEFQISSGELPSRSMLGMTSDLFDELRKVYRKAFENLEREGRIEDAAFVLLELLHANEEGVEFLERNGRPKLAAEVAEARRLPPGLVIRLWFQAGDPARAIRIARRTGAFADAVLRLERSDAAKGARLRLLWAETLAAAGDFSAAIEAIWPAADQRPAAAEWMDRAIGAGGPVAARMLGRKLGLFPEQFAAIREQALELLGGVSEPELEARQSFAHTLSEQGQTPQTRVLARAALRSVIRDAARGPASKALIDRLVNLADDGALRSDVRQLPPLSPPAEASGQTHLADISAADVGSLAFRDAARLPSGRFLVALGEAGVRLLGPEGKTLAHFDQPAERLVLSDAGHHAIALARRGEAWRLARLDLLSRRSALWCLASFDECAAGYDGLVWFVAQGDTLLAVDPLAEGFEALWRVREEGARIRCLTRAAGTLACCVEKGKAAEVWSFELPSLTMRGRAALPVAPSPDVGVSAEGRVALLRPNVPREGAPADGHALSLIQGGQVAPFLFQDAGAQVQPPVISARWAILRFMLSGGARLHVVELAGPGHRATLALGGAGWVSAQLAADRLTLADDRGRLLVYDCQARRLAVNLRL